MPIEYNSRRQLTAYALACGCVQRWNDSKPNYLRNVSLHLWKEHGTFHVRAHDFETEGRILWESFNNLTQARKHFSQSKKGLRAKFKHRQTTTFPFVK